MHSKFQKQLQLTLSEVYTQGVEQGKKKGNFI